MKSFFHIVLLALLLCLNTAFYGQYLDFALAKNITHVPGDDLFPKWSANGQYILYQTDRNGSWDIFRYSFTSDTSMALVASDANEQHPVYYGNEKYVVFDRELASSPRLYKSEIATGKTSLLFNRDIDSRQAAFTKTEKLVYFTGLEPLSSTWQIYSFEFYYENLNQLTDSKAKNHLPVVFPDEDHIIFVRTDGQFPYDHLHIMNWYGEEEQEMFDMHITDPSWDASGFKVYFISRNGNPHGDLYSIWIDGSHLEKILPGDVEMRNPQVSPDGKYLAISVKLDDGFDIFILPFEDY